MDLSNLLQGALGNEILGKVTQQTGIPDNQVQNAVAAAIPLLLGSLAQNSTSQEGANALWSALSKDHDGSILNNVENIDLGSGAKILGHIFGKQEDKANETVSQHSGINAGQAQILLQVLAPIVLGYLGKQQRQNGLDASGLAGMLGGILQQSSGSNSPAMNIVTQFLDKNKDGNMVDDVAKMGMNILGKMFK